MMLFCMTEIQGSLSFALTHWLYGSISPASLKDYSLSRYYTNAQPILNCIKAFQKAEISLPQEVSMFSEARVSTTQYAEMLSIFFKLWEQYIPQTNIRGNISKGQPFQAWMIKGGLEDRYWPVQALHKLINNSNQFFVRAIVHGSVATLDDMPGFSDLDLAFIIRSSVLKDPKQLLNLRRLASKILTLTYTFDPFMHHGPYYIPETDLKWYPEAFFPSILFSYGVDLLNNSRTLEIWARPSEDITNKQLNTFERFFKNWPSNPFVLKDSFELEWVLSSTMILPVLYLQSKTGEFRYKRDTFPLAEKDFSPEEWEPVKKASKLRASLCARPKPPRPLVWAAFQLQWPGLLQRWARRHPRSIQRAQKAAEALGPDYPQRVLRLLESMRSKLELLRYDNKSHLVV